METKINEVSPHERELEVTLSYEEIKEEMDAFFKKESKKITIDGYRPGKVPLNIVKKLFGKDIEYRASENIANKTYWDIVEKDNLKPVSVPSLIDLNYESNDKLFFKISYEVIPDIQLKEYKNLEIGKPVFVLQEEDVKKEIDYIKRSNAKTESAEIIIDENNLITVSAFRLDENGNEQVGSYVDNLMIDLTDSRVNKNIIENAIGKKLEEDFEFKIHDHRHVKEGDEEKIIHEDFFYRAKVKKIDKIVLPELTEEIIKKVSKNRFSTEDELSENIRKDIINYYEYQSNQIYLDNLLNTIIEKNDFTAPNGYIKTILESLVKSEIEKAEKNKSKKFSEQELKEKLNPQAEWTAKWYILFDKIAKVENITISDEELMVAAESESQQYGIPKEKLLEYYENNGSKKVELKENKVIQFLKENNIIKEIDPSDKSNNNEEHHHHEH